MYKYIIASVLSLAPLSCLAVDSTTQVQAAQAIYYTHPACASCVKVKNYLHSINRTITTRDISNPAYKDELAKLGHQKVPVLAISNQTIIGADAIINYLKQHPEVLK